MGLLELSKGLAEWCGACQQRKILSSPKGVRGDLDSYVLGPKCTLSHVTSENQINVFDRSLNSRVHRALLTNSDGPNITQM